VAGFNGLTYKIDEWTFLKLVFTYAF